MSENLSATDPVKRIILGKVTGYYGVRGWVKLFSYTDQRDNILGYQSLQVKLKGAWKKITLDAGKAHGKGVIAHFSGYDSREAAALLLGAELAVTREDFAPLGKGDYYWHDLIGLQVKNREGIVLGKVRQIIETAAHDVLLIQAENLQSAHIQSEHSGINNAPENEILIPFVLGHYIVQVELDKGFILVDWDPEWNSEGG